MTLSVGDILESGMPRGHLILDVAMTRLGRLKLGQEAHREYQDLRREVDPSFQSEVTLKHQVVVDDWTVQITGRIDGLSEENGRTVVEEVKSTALDGQRLLRTDLGDWPSYTEQLQIYLWMLAQARYERPLGRLVLVSLLDGARHLIGIDPDTRVIDAFVRQRLAEFILARRRRRRWLLGRKSRPPSSPFRAWRDGQEQLSDAVEAGLREGASVFLEAPTGMGKTAAALMSVLRLAFEKEHQVFWATARTTQQRVVEDTIRRMVARGTPLRFVTLASKERACLNTIMDCRPESCNFARDYYDKIRADDVLNSLVDEGGADVTRLAEVGERRQLCPYQLGRDVAAHVDVVIGDYNYAFDPGITSRRCPPDSEAKRWLVVVDEAHGLVARARGYGSPTVSAEVCQAAGTLCNESPSYRHFAYLCREIEFAVADAAELAIGSEREGQAVTEVSKRVWRDLAERVEEVALDYARLKAVMPLVDAGQDDPWLRVARSVLRFYEVLRGAGDETVGVATLVRDREKLGLLCLDPGSIVGPRIRSFAGFVAMSATLSPLDYYRDVLGLRAADVRHVETPFYFPPENRKVLVAPRVSTAYADRAGHADSTAELVMECVAAIPGNVAIYFPSFRMLQDIADRCDFGAAITLRQYPEMADGQRRAWLDTLQRGTDKTILLAVLGGIFSEGVDLPGGSLAGVLVVGPSLPPVGLERDLIREFCEERYGDGFRYAFLIPGMTRVVQAAGRLIRGPDDRGVVVLIGRRFRWRDYAALLPASWERFVAAEPVTEIREFWESF